MKSPEETFLQWVYDRIEFDHGDGPKLFSQERFSAICGIMGVTCIAEYRKQPTEYAKDAKSLWGWRMHQQFEYLKNNALEEGWSIEMVRTWIENFFEPRQLAKYSNQEEILQVASKKVSILVSKLKEGKYGPSTSS